MADELISFNLKDDGTKERVLDAFDLLFKGRPDEMAKLDWVKKHFKAYAKSIVKNAFLKTYAEGGPGAWDAQPELNIEELK
jgi:hypothetical protein